MSIAFLNCSHPVQISTLKGLRLVRCGKCVQCRDFKRQTISSALQTECFAHKYHLFITLTYDNNNIPYLDFRVNYENREDSFMPKMVRNAPKVCMAHNLHTDCIPDGSTISYGDIAPNNVIDLINIDEYLNQYNERKRKYMARYPDRDYSHDVFADDVVPIVHFPDLQKFLKRLRITLKRKYNVEKIRFYAIGEYGTNSLRPHWHIILLHDSSELNDICRNQKEWTPVRTRQDGKIMYSFNPFRSLWKYGTEVTEIADTNVYTYLASYVNQSASYPVLLQKFFPQKCSHSSYLGEYRSASDMQRLFKEKAFDELTTIRKVITTRGTSIEREFAAPLSSYMRYTPRFTGLGTMSYEEIYRTLASGIKLIKQSKDVSISQMSKDLYITLSAGLYNSIYDDIVNNYGIYLKNAIDNKSIGCITRYFYACKRVINICRTFNISLYEYVFNYLKEFVVYLKNKQLCNLFETLQADSDLSAMYYNSFDIEGNQSFALYRTNRFYLQSLQQSIVNYHANIKHLEVAESYKF